MAGAYLGLELLNAAMDAEEKVGEDDGGVEMRGLLRNLRDTLDPFDLPEKVFRRKFRVSRKLAWDLTEHLRPNLERQRSSGIAPERQVCIALSFFGTGSNQAIVGDSMFCAVSQPTVSRCVKDVAQAINEVLLREWVKFPATREERDRSKRAFSTAEQPFEGAMGAIDCTHVAIIAPRQHEEAYVNHHGYHSMNVQMICDPDFKILQVCARYGGRTHDAFIWRASPVRANMQENYENGERNTYIIGDSGYPLEPWLMTPIPDAPLDSREYRYTSYHCKARSVIERCFGLLKTFWQCLSKKRVLWYGPVAAGRFINACAVLHNLRLHYKIDDMDFEEDGADLNFDDHYEPDDPDEIEEAPVVAPNAELLDMARETRENFIARIIP